MKTPSCVRFANKHSFVIAHDEAALQSQYAATFRFKTHHAIQTYRKKHPSILGVGNVEYHYVWTLLSVRTTCSLFVFTIFFHM